MIERGPLQDVIARAEGSSLAAPAAVGASSLTVANVTDFRESGGQLSLNGVTYSYSGYVGTTLALAGGTVTVAGDEGDEVLSLNDLGQSESRVYARVRIDDEDEEPVEAEIPTGQRGYFPLGDAAAGALVDVESMPTGYRVVSRPFDTDVLDGAQVYNPLVSGYLAVDTPWTDASWEVIGWTFEDQVDVPYDPASKRFTVVVGGVYLLSAGAVFASNDSGRRGLAIWIENGSGSAFLARRIVIPADGLTATEATRIIRLYEGDRVYVEAFQTSGASLDLLDNTTNIGILRVAP